MIKKSSFTNPKSKINSIDQTNTIPNFDNYLNTFSGIGEEERKTLPMPTQFSVEPDYNQFQFNTEGDEGLSPNKNIENHKFLNNNTQHNYFRSNKNFPDRIQIINEFKNSKINNLNKKNNTDNKLQKNKNSFSNNFKYLPDYKADNLVKNLLRGKLD